MQDLSDKRVVVMGLGRFGGGIGASRFLAEKNARVLVTDRAPREKLEASIKVLAGLPIEFRLGEHREEDFTQADLIVASPAVDPKKNPYLAAAAAVHIPVTTEIRLLIERLPNRDRTIGVTGSAGKSTVTAMIGHVLTKMYEHDGGAKVHVGGNIGGSLLDSLDQIQSDDWVVLELSSFMLDSLAEDEWSPHIAVVTNILPNHLDRHGTFENYVQAKQAILRYQVEQDIALLGRTVRHWESAARIWIVDNQQTQVKLQIPGDHNQLNAHMAMALCTHLYPHRSQRDGLLADFSGLDHRLQFVLERQGVRYYNDSKSTTPESAMLALQSWGQGIVHVILGGFDKHSDFHPMARFAANHSRTVYTIGATGDAIADLCETAGTKCDVVRCGTLDRAVTEASIRVRCGDVVLLSPGCASWDQFDNYVERGKAFVNAVTGSVTS